MDVVFEGHDYRLRGDADQGVTVALNGNIGPCLKYQTPMEVRLRSRTGTAVKGATVVEVLVVWTHRVCMSVSASL